MWKFLAGLWRDIQQSAVARLANVIVRSIAEDWFSWAVATAIVAPLLVVFYRESLGQPAPFSWFADNWGDFLGSIIGGIVAFLLARYTFRHEMKSRRLLEASRIAEELGKAISTIRIWRKENIGAMRGGTKMALEFIALPRLPARESPEVQEEETARRKQAQVAERVLTQFQKPLNLTVGLNQGEQHKIDTFWNFQSSIVEITLQLRSMKQEAQQLLPSIPDMVQGGQKSDIDKALQGLIERSEWIEYATGRVHDDLKAIMEISDIPPRLDISKAPKRR